MEQADLESYQYQLAQVKQAYAADPTNAEIVTLKEELESLIKLCHEYLGAAQASTSSKPAQTDSPKPAAASASKPQKRKAPDAAPYANPTKDIKPGDECLARYSGDGKMYPAKVISIGGSSENTVFSVIFKGYESSELVSAADVKAMSVDKKRQLELQAEEEEREKRRKKNAKKSETRQQKNQEQLTKQAAWQSFAKKSVSGKAKKVHIPGVAGESMFKTPDNPYGKVGVVGSGKGMTASSRTTRHIFEEGKSQGPSTLG